MSTNLLNGARHCVVGGSRRYVRFVHSGQRIEAGAIPGAVHWIEEQDACQRVMNARGQVVVDDLSAAAIKLLAEAKEVMPSPGRFYMLHEGKVQYNHPPNLVSETEKLPEFSPLV
jgi:hypothetical protein